MLLHEIEREARVNHLVHQLFSLKRCFGPQASIGIVVSGCETDYCSTVHELFEKSHIPYGFDWLDTFFVLLPRISHTTDSATILTPNKYYDDGPLCPWDVARREQNAAKDRAKAKRQSCVKSKTFVIQISFITKGSKINDDQA